LEPRKIKFIDRIVADSRDVALNHTAGLALPQQVMMSLFSLAEMMDGAKLYQKACLEIVHRRAKAMVEGLGIEVTPNPLYNAYYGLIDFEFFARKNIGQDAVEYLKKNVHPLDLAFRLAEDHGIVLLNGGGFEAPDWSLRVSWPICQTKCTRTSDAAFDRSRAVTGMPSRLRNAPKNRKRQPHDSPFGSPRIRG